MKTRPVKLPIGLKKANDTPEEPTLHRRPRVTLRDVLARCEEGYLEYIRLKEIASPYDFVTPAGKKTRDAWNVYFVALGDLPATLAKGEEGFTPSTTLLGYLARAQAAYAAYVDAAQKVTSHDFMHIEHAVKREMFDQWFESLNTLYIQARLEVNR